ncbi:MAG: YifB family Mg chelatase-like AAA ATPase [Spirochaetales bacterium]|nr:YifB family Mg chelatase-like AAA ATPase [Spirochaetales bacterium]
MEIYAYAASGFQGALISVEVDIRRGIPAFDIVGLPDGAVRESRERVRVALRRCGYTLPAQHILVNLAPGSLRKEGTGYDLAIALGLLVASGQLEQNEETGALLCIGELLLDGRVLPVPGVLPAAAAALELGVEKFLVPQGNLEEAQSLPRGRASGLHHLQDLPQLFTEPWPEPSVLQFPSRSGMAGEVVDLAEMRGQPILRRMLEIAAAGGHHLLLFGPPGSGKTMACRSLPGLLPPLMAPQSLQATRIWSQAGKLAPEEGLLYRPPFREPHHSASAEGMVGGGASLQPGEVSLAHEGVLFLDEVPEFAPRVLQALREPLGSQRVSLSRAGRSTVYPARFQMVLAMNACPCGNLGKADGSCTCMPHDIRRYWRRLGGALLDRVDLRMPLHPEPAPVLLQGPGECSERIAERVLQCQRMQRERQGNRLNVQLTPQDLNQVATLGEEARFYLGKAVDKLALSSRAVHSCLRVARTIADLDDRPDLVTDDLLEALEYRRFGDKDLSWFVL